MKAVQISRFGGPDILEIVEIPTPEPGPGQILLRTRVAGINFADTLMREDHYVMTPPLPAILGSEAAGTVAALGEGITEFQIGDRVAAPLFAAGNYFSGYAEYAVIDAAFVTALPAALSFEHATALMVQGLTALHLVRQASPAGKTVLVTAAAGGVGSLLLQLAKEAGAKTVIAAASNADKLTYARALGADAGVDYTRPHWIEELRTLTAGGPDLIYESVGGDVTTAGLEALAPLGRIVIYGALNARHFQLGVPELVRLIFGNQSISGFALVPLLTPEILRTDLTDLFERAAQGRLKVTIGASYALDQASAAHRTIEARDTRGKVVLTA